MRKLLLIIAALVVVSAVALVLVVRSILSPDSVRATLEQQLTAHFGEPVSIGSAHAAVFPRVAVKLEQVAVGKLPLVTIQQISIATGLRGLFDRRVEEAEVVLSNGQIRLPAALKLTAPFTRPVAADPEHSFSVASVRVISLRNVEFIVDKASLHLNLESALDGDRLEVSKLTARSARTELEASGTLTSLSSMQGAFTATASPLDVDELLTLASGATTTSNAADVPAHTTSTVPMRIALDVNAPSGRFTGYEFTNLTAKLEAMPARVTMTTLALGTFGGNFKGSLDLDSSRSIPRMTLRGRLDGVDVSQLATTAGVAGAITGRLGGNVVLTADGTQPQEILRTARGSASAAITNGAIPGLDMVRTIVLAFGKPSGAPAAGSGSAFSTLGGDFMLQSGVLRTDNLSMASRDFDLRGRATLAIPGGSLDATVDVILSKELTSQAGTDLRRFAQEDGRVIVPARITGPLGHPQVAPDIAAAARRALENELKRRTKGFLEGLFKKKK
jgi:uncharacterized protein involved in outer membrane biogenesis